MPMPMPMRSMNAGEDPLTHTCQLGSASPLPVSPSQSSPCLRLSVFSLWLQCTAVLPRQAACRPVRVAALFCTSRIMFLQAVSGAEARLLACCTVESGRYTSVVDIMSQQGAHTHMCNCARTLLLLCHACY